MKIKICLYNAFIFLFVFFTVFFILLPDWIARVFGSISFEQIIFTVMLPLKGTSSDLADSFVSGLIKPAFIISSLTILIIFVNKNVKYSHVVKYSKIIFYYVTAFFNVLNKNKQKFIIFFIIVFSFAVFLGICVLFFNSSYIIPNKFYNSNKSVINRNSLIAHAGGEIEEKNYTNSMESVNKSIKSGYKYIELDIILTNENKMAAAHDWKHYRTITNQEISDDAMDINNFKKQKIYGKYTPITEEDINNIFSSSNDFILVTDKIDNFALLSDSFKFKERLIVETFSVQKYKEALSKGILYPALCVNSIISINNVLKNKIKMVTVNKDFFLQNLMIFRYIHRIGVVIMVYGTNTDDISFLKNNLGINCSLAYVDNVLPENTTVKSVMKQ